MPLSRRIRRLLIIAASVLAVFAVAIFATAAYVYSLSLLTAGHRRYQAVGRRCPRTRSSTPPTAACSRNGTVMRTVRFVGSAEIPDGLKQAVVAIEDKRFYQAQRR